MRKRNREKNEEARLMDTIELQAYLSLGRNSAVDIGNKAGSRVNFGRRVLWDRKKIDLYLDSISAC